MNSYNSAIEDLERAAARRRAAAVEALRGRGPLLVALSGGVDSAVLLALAIEAAGTSSVTAVTGDSASLSRADIDAARQVAAYLGVRHELVHTHEIANPAYRANTGDRCFHCRMELFRVLQALAAARGGATLAYGAIKDDLADDRPGMRAAQLKGVIAPLLSAGADKRDVRKWAGELGLPVAGRPASACLASRIPVGTEVSAARMRRVERAEAALRDLGFVQLRVRDHGETARLEVDAGGGVKLSDPGLRAAALAAVRRAGFDRVEIDPRGYRGALATDPGAPKRAGGQ